MPIGCVGSLAAWNRLTAKVAEVLDVHVGTGDGNLQPHLFDHPHYSQQDTFFLLCECCPLGDIEIAAHQDFQRTVSEINQVDYDRFLFDIFPVGEQITQALQQRVKLLRRSAIGDAKREVDLPFAQARSVENSGRCQHTVGNGDNRLIHLAHARRAQSNLFD